MHAKLVSVVTVDDFFSTVANWLLSLQLKFASLDVYPVKVKRLSRVIYDLLNVFKYEGITT